MYEDTPVGTTVYTLIGKVKPCPTLSAFTTPSRLQDEQIELEMLEVLYNGSVDPKVLAMFK